MKILCLIYYDNFVRPLKRCSNKVVFRSISS